MDFRWPISPNPPRASGSAIRRLAEAGPIDILVNNVGGRNLDIAVEDTDLKTWQQFIDLNLTHCFICTKTHRRRDAEARQGARHQYCLDQRDDRQSRHRRQAL